MSRTLTIEDEFQQIVAGVGAEGVTMTHPFRDPVPESEKEAEPSVEDPAEPEDGAEQAGS